MISYVLCFSLIITHAFMADSNVSKSNFYLPKVALCIAMFVVICLFQVCESNNSLAYYRNGF